MSNALDHCVHWTQESVAGSAVSYEFTPDTVLLFGEFKSYMGGRFEFSFGAGVWIETDIVA
jgi:hypothetical protein